MGQQKHAIEGYVAIRHTQYYGPRDAYRVVGGLMESRADAEAARDAADAADTHPRELCHNEASRSYRLAEAVEVIDWTADLYDLAEHYARGDVAAILRDAGWSADEIEEGADNHETVQAGVDALLASADLLLVQDPEEASNLYIVRLID
jgi:hypothetical protein